MFDFDATKFLIVGVIALIFIPPKDLPRVLRQVGQFVGRMRRMASEFQGQFMEAMREADMADIRAEAQKLSDSARLDLGLDKMKSLDMHLRDAVAGEPLVPPSSTDLDAAPATPTETSDTKPDGAKLGDAAPSAPPSTEAHRPDGVSAPMPYSA